MPFITATIGELFEQQVAIDPQQEFVVYPEHDLRFTYGEFNEQINRLAKGLLAIGVSKSDHVGIWARNVPEWLMFLFATAKIGAVLVTVNTAYKSHELSYVLKQSDMKALAIVDGFRDVNYVNTLYELVPELHANERANLSSSAFPRLKSVIYIGQEEYQGIVVGEGWAAVAQQSSDEAARADGKQAADQLCAPDHAAATVFRNGFAHHVEGLAKIFVWDLFMKEIGH